MSRALAFLVGLALAAHAAPARPACVAAPNDAGAAVAAGCLGLRVVSPPAGATDRAVWLSDGTTIVRVYPENLWRPAAVVPGDPSSP